jgi:hypothetical protein
LQNKLDQLEQMKFRPKLIVITETWLSNEICEFFNIDGYNVVHNCRGDGYAGIARFVAEGVSYDVVRSETAKNLRR